MQDDLPAYALWLLNIEPITPDDCGTDDAHCGRARPRADVGRRVSKANHEQPSEEQLAGHRFVKHAHAPPKVLLAPPPPAHGEPDSPPAH